MARTKQIRNMGDPGPGLNKSGSGTTRPSTAGSARRVPSEFFYNPQARFADATPVPGEVVSSDEEDAGEKCAANM